MSLSRLLTHRLTVSRLTATTGAMKTYQDVATDLPGLIQPQDYEGQQAAGGAIGKQYVCFTDLSANVREGDRVNDQDGKVYFVRGLRRRNYGRSFPHLELLLYDDKRP